MPKHAPGIINNHITDWLIVHPPPCQSVVVSFKIPIELNWLTSSMGCHCPYMPECAPSIINNHITDWPIVYPPPCQSVVVSFKIPIELNCHHLWVVTALTCMNVLPPAPARVAPPTQKLGQGCWLLIFFSHQIHINTCI